MVSPCPICEGTNIYYSFVSGQERFDECWDCGLLHHKATDGKPAEELDYEASAEDLGEQFARSFFTLLKAYCRSSGIHIGLLGHVPFFFQEEASRQGWSVKTVQWDDLTSSPYDVLIVMNLLERTAMPQVFLSSLRRFLKPGGILAVLSKQLVRTGTRSTGEEILSARQRYSFTNQNLQNLLLKTGFENLSLTTYETESKGSEQIQKWLKDQAVIFGRMCVTRVAPRLSIVLPVYNEANTVPFVLDALCDKKISGMETEIIVVESASTDGSREIVKRYTGRPGVKLVFQNRPSGKGSAVREGLSQATGNIILIQDADLEYDLLDYEMLLSPIVRGKASFVLGTRHAGNWKIRQFNQYFLANVLNMGHWFLVFVMNRLYRQKMTDPFTMFKVFRKDCLYGLDLECNRFDFDIELVCKLLRKGYTPLEIPVNYQARSFGEGKKVRIFRDPLTWIIAMFKYRFQGVHSLPDVNGEGASDARSLADTV